ncbi:MAG: hypothetical protein K0A93_04635 [Desulfuromonadaceae bacterium]|nr:hypothetical protein [Desulfuromonadaceae bacterium]
MIENSAYRAGCTGPLFFSAQTQGRHHYQLNFDVLKKTHGMAKQKFSPTMPDGFSGAKTYIRQVEVLKKQRNAAGRIFCDAITFDPADFIGRPLFTGHL